MPASSCLPKSAITLSDSIVTTSKGIAMPVIKNPASSNFLPSMSSFVPIKPRQQNNPSSTGVLQSIVRSMPSIIPDTPPKLTIINSKSNNIANNNNQVIYHPRQPNTVITRVLPNNHKMTSEISCTQASAQVFTSSDDNHSVIDMEKKTYSESRKRKRKQDLSSLSRLNSYLNDSQYDEMSFFNPDELRNDSLKCNQMEDGSFYYRPQYNDFSPAKKQCSLNRFDSGNNSAFRSNALVSDESMNRKFS